MARCAIILAAGEGRRLRPLTDLAPKCMVEVCGRSILANALDAFAGAGVERAVIVVGHLADVVRRAVGTFWKGMAVEYIENSEYATTNSMYSLHLGMRHARESAWVLEGDVFFEPAVLARPVQQEISWFVDASRKDLDGAYIRFDERRRALSLDIVRDLKLLTGRCGKSIGLLHLGGHGSELVSGWLDRGVADGQKNLYYDLVVGPRFGDAHVEVVDVGGLRWFEIDNLTDLENARKMFA